MGTLLVAFDKDTDFGWLEGEVPCDELVDFPGAADASCEWQTASVVVATLENGATVLPGDAATLVWEEIRAACPYEDDPWYCECWPAAAATSVTIAPPDEPLIPEVVVEAPRSVGVCGGLEVDAAMSSGSGGRDFTDVTWSVQFLDNTLSDENKTAMLDAVAGAAGSTLLEVPAEALAGVADTSVRFGLSLTNYLAGTGSDDAAALVQKHASYKRLEIVAAASVSGCDGQALSTNGLTYAWSLAGFPGVQSTSVDPRRFRLDAYALSAATDYALDVTVADVAGRNNSASVIVSVGESPVEAAVDNGEFAVGNAEVFTLDASPSRDPDQTAAGVGLDYAWTTNGTVVSTAASFTVDAATLAAGRKHTFAVFRARTSREVVAIAYVVDQYGAKARASATAVVETRELTTAQLANLTDSLLYAAFDTGNTEAVYQTLNSAGTLLGKANCSLDCADYGREVCSAAAPDSCGACLAGTVGSAAPSTFACRSATATCSTKGATCGRDCAPCAVDEACFGDEDCDSGYCDSGLCAYPPLTCASNCTGQGFCVFVDKTAAYAELPEGLACTVADASWCQTKCVCDAGWYGDACE
ncbi:hypothetical protein JL721_4348 [Aureococcus anophagefferens]|nr:hypothetical protein JL721_4348 [Aureococcus anophagefferens]